MRPAAEAHESAINLETCLDPLSSQHAGTSGLLPKQTFPSSSSRTSNPPGSSRPTGHLASLNSDTSRPFDKPKNTRIAAKVIHHLRDEVMKVFWV